MKAIVDKDTGKVLFGCFEFIPVNDNEIIIDKFPTGDFYNFETEEFYTVEQI